MIRQYPLRLALITTLFLFLGCSLFAQNATEPTRFMGFSWGASFKDCLKQTKQSNGNVKAEKGQFIIYRADDTETKLEFDPIWGLVSIVSSRNFENGNSKEAMNYFNGSAREVTQNYGEYQSHKAQTKEVMLFEWKFKKTMISLVYHISSNTVTLGYYQIHG